MASGATDIYMPSGQRDGYDIHYRVARHVGRPNAVVVFQLGTLSHPQYGDLLADALVTGGNHTLYAVQARSRPCQKFTGHADDLQQVVASARRDNPGVPICVMGVSLGALIALEWDLRHNRSQVPVAALSPVVMPRFSYLGPVPMAVITAGLLLRHYAVSAVASPLSAGIALTTNPASMEYGKHDPAKTVPAGLFDDVLKMTADVSLHAGRKAGPLLVVRAGDDKIANNTATGLWSKLFGNRDLKLITINGAAHDLSQETNHSDLVRALVEFASVGRTVV
jgi:alpha-beta hydrolase superfamily lysophospholipase